VRARYLDGTSSKAAEKLWEAELENLAIVQETWLENAEDASVLFAE
jgi:hypothetical protein